MRRISLHVCCLLIAACGGAPIPAKIDGAPVDAAGPCLGATCGAAEFCYVRLAGRPVPPDAGVIDAGPADAGVIMPGCNALPAACAGTPTCACLLANVGMCFGALTCSEDADGPRVTCSLP